MAFIDWRDEFNLNIELIDNQHKVLVRLINQLHTGMVTGHSDDIMSEILKELLDYTVNHFSTEEKIFKEIGYVDAKNHAREHAGFIKEIKTFKEQFENNHSIVTIKLMMYLKDWLLRHIQGTDRKYIDAFVSNGIK